MNQRISKIINRKAERDAIVIVEHIKNKRRKADPKFVIRNLRRDYKLQWNTTPRKDRKQLKQIWADEL